MEKSKLLYKLTGTENPKFITERENVMIDKFLAILNQLEDAAQTMNEELQAGRDYLMQVEANKITVEDTLEAFGFGRNGLRF